MTLRYDTTRRLRILKVIGNVLLTLIPMGLLSVQVMIQKDVNQPAPLSVQLDPASPCGVASSG